MKSGALGPMWMWLLLVIQGSTSQKYEELRKVRYDFLDIDQSKHESTHTYTHTFSWRPVTRF